MSFMDAVKSCFGKYATFSGRASRSEFWFFTLFIFIVMIALYAVIFSSMDFGGMMMGAQNGTLTPEQMSGSFPVIPFVLLGVFVLVTILPNLSVMVRRLHDTNRSGWWYWIALIPLVGPIVLIVFFATQGTDGDNDFGADPLA